jgi:hypothetical protein
MGELPNEARLADTWLAHGGDHLPLTSTGALEREVDRFHLGGAADEPGEPAGRGGLQTGARRADSNQFVDLNGGRDALDAPEAL